MMIGRAVTCSERIDLANFSRDVKALIAPFACAEKLYAIAEEEVVKVNTFCVTGLNYQPAIGVHEIRHLVVYLPVQIEGTGPVPITGPRSWMTPADRATLDNIDTRFYRLESLTIQVIDTGTIDPLASYTMPGGSVFMASATPQLAAAERAVKVYEIARRLKDISLSHLRANAALKRKLVLVQDHRARTTEVPDITISTSNDETSKAVYHMLDTPRASMTIT